MAHDIHSHLATLLQCKLCVVGIGNRLCGDDGLGPTLIDAIGARAAYPCFDAGVAPENYLEKIVSTGAEVVCVVDAMDFGGEAGAIRIVAPGDLAAGLSTHALSLELTAEYLRSRGDVEVWLIAVQPARTDLNSGLSAAVADAVRHLAAAFLRTAS